MNYDIPSGFIKLICVFYSPFTPSELFGLILFSKKMKQDQADAKKKRDEASQHPRSEMKRVVLARVKADGVESEREGESECGDDDSPTQQPARRFAFRFGKSLFGEGEGFLVVHVAQEGEEAEDDDEDADDAETGDNVVHGKSF